MEILIAGDWRWPIYEDALASGLRTAGADVSSFKFSDYIGGKFTDRIQLRLLAGPAIWRLNRDLRNHVLSSEPDVLFLHRATLIHPRTVSSIKESHPKIRIVSFNNDNPFADKKRTSLWRHYLKYLAYCDLNYFYRRANVDSAREEGIPNPRLLLSYYVEGLHRPRSADEVSDDFKNDVVFVGHFEPDGRLGYLEHLMSNGIDVQIFGTRWDEVPRSSIVWNRSGGRVSGEDYVCMLSGAKIALGFLSGANRDQYTRRCFEIPACGTLLVAPRTHALRELFVEDKEAAFFETKEELLDTVRFYLSHPDTRQKVAAAGLRRCQGDGHSNVDRGRTVLSQIRAMT